MASWVAYWQEDEPDREEESPDDRPWPVPSALELAEGEARAARLAKAREDEWRAAVAYVRALGWYNGPFVSSDSRDLRREMPADLNPRSVLEMRAMLSDVKANGDRPWPYKRDAA